MATVVSASGISLELPNGRELFKNLSFSIDDGLNALVGPNGVGKTSLARLLASELSPTRGVIRTQGPITLFSQLELPKPITVVEQLALFYGWSELGEELLAGIDRHTLCTQLSGGEWMRVRLACSLDEQFIILDEPTNNLDRAARQMFQRFLRGRRGGALLISHDRACLNLCDQIFELSNHGLSRYGGGFADYLEEKEREQQSAAAALHLAKRKRTAAQLEQAELRARQEKRTRRGALKAARGGMPKIILGSRKSNAQTTSGKLDVASSQRWDAAVRSAHEAFARLKVDPAMYAEFSGTAIAAQKVVAEASNFNIWRGRWLYREDLVFSWRGGLKLSVRGGNGTGKSTLLRALAGEKFTSRGELRPGALTTAWIDQPLASLNDEQTVFESIVAVSSRNESEIRSGLASFLFPGDKAFQRVASLSGGERLRVALAQAFLGSVTPELLMMDEPTNNLDLTNINFLEGLLQNFRGALIVVSHDDIFLERCGVNEQLTLD